MKIRSATSQKFLTFCTSCLLAGSTFFAGPLFANPEGGVVAAGSATISQSGNQTVINQSSDKAIINWQGFSIGANEHTQFSQPGAGSIALNRVVGNNASKIMGQLQANGQVWIVNPAGILFGPGANVNVSSLLATTANIANSDFMSGNYHFVQDPNNSNSVINQGRIQVADGGFVALIAPGVVNSGVIQARLGKVALASGNEYTVDLTGDQLINFAVNNKVTQKPVDENGNALADAVANHGSIIADGGTITMTANVARGVVQNVINMDGIAQANSAAVGHNGVIILAGGDAGTVRVAGKLMASGKNAGTKGGTVKVLGEQVELTSNANIDVTGDVGGGEVLIGGNARGQGPEQNAQITTIAAGANIDASAITNGNGGQVVVWSNSDTEYYGNIVAQGGSQGGDAGSAEVSGDFLNFQGTVDLTAPYGKMGTLLLDPHNITISTGSNTQTFANPYVAANDNSILNITTLQTALNSANVTVQTGTTGAQAGNITVGTSGADTLVWSGATTLTLLANQNITVNASLVENLSGGSLVLHADATGSGIGAITLGASANLDFENGGSVTFFYNPASFPTPTNFGSQVVVLGSGKFLPYMLVNTPTQLQAISSNLSGDYALGKSIDMTAVSFTPIGASGTPFTGRLNGNSNTISNLAISQTSGGTDVGLFADAQLATISNLGLINAIVTGNTAATGALVGNDGVGGSANGSTITNVYSLNGTVSATSGNIGGLIGTNFGAISNSFTTGSVTGRGNVGGLVGVNKTTINTSYNASAVSNTANNSLVGGLVGFMDVGSVINNAYNIGSVTNSGSAVDVGGLVGANSVGTITKSYSSGVVTSSGSSNSVGGLVGANGGTVTGSFWDSSSSGQSVGATGTTSGIVGGCFTGGANCLSGSAVLSSQNTYSGTPAWDFSTIWFSVDGLTRPFLQMENVAAIQTAHQLQAVSANLSGSYTLSNNIDLSASLTNAADIWGNINGTTATIGKGFAPIGSAGSQFTGTFTGNNNILSNFTINLPAVSTDVGLFADTTGATISNVGFINANVTGGSGNTGVLVGLMTGAGSQVSQTYSINGTVAGNNSAIGGLVGRNQGTISQSFTTGNVNSQGNVSGNFGGLLGINDGTVTNSYSLANVVGITAVPIGSQVGGLVGNNNTGTISFSYSAGAVSSPDSANVGGLVGLHASTTTASFWDASSSGQSTSVGGTGESTANMMTLSTFTNASWNIGAGNTWNIIPGVSYPYLTWYFPGGPQIVSGTVYTSSSQITPGSFNNTVALASGGVSLNSIGASTPTFANGAYYFALNPTTVPAGNLLLAYTSSNSALAGNTLINTTGANTTALAIAGNTVLAAGSTVLSNTQFNTAKIANAGVLYSGSGSNLTVNSGTGFQTSASTPYNLDGNITTTNTPINFQNTVTLTGNATLSAGSGNITLNQLDDASDGIHGLVLNSSGITTLQGLTGSVHPINSITTDASGSIVLNASVTAASVINFGDPTTLNNDITLNVGTITLAAVDSSIATAHALTLNASSVTSLTGNIGSNHPLTSLITDATGFAVLGGNVNAATTVTFNDPVTLTASSIFAGASTNSFANTTNLQGNALTLNGSGTTTFTGVVSGAGGSLAQSAGIAILSSHNTYTGSTTLTGGTLEANNAINALGTGTLNLNGGTLLALTAANLGNSSFNVSNSPTIAGSSALTFSGTGTLNSGANLNITTGNTVTFNGAINGASSGVGTITSTAINTTFGAAVGNSFALSSLSTSAAALNGGTINTAGSQTYNGAVTLGISNASLTTNNATLTFNGTVNGAENLTINSGNAATAFNAAVGGSTPLGTGIGAAIVLNSSGATTFASTLAAAAGMTATGTVIFDNNVTLAHSSTPMLTSLTGSVTFSPGAGGMTFSAADGATFGSNGFTPVSFSGGPLTINTTNSALTFNGPVNGTQTLTMGTGSGNITFVALNNFPNIAFTSAHNVQFGDLSALSFGASTLTGNLTVATVFGGGAITQSGALIVPGTASFSINAHPITLTANNNFGTVTFNNSGANNVSVTDVNGIILGASTVGGNLTVTAGGAITDSGAINAGTLTTSSVGGTVLNFGHTVTGFNATNTGSGNIQLTNTTSTLAVTGISESGSGNVVVSNTGSLTTSGAVSTAGGNVNLLTLGAGTITIGSNINTSGGSINVTATNTNQLATAITINSQLNTSPGSGGALLLGGGVVFGGGGSTNVGAGSIILLGNAQDLTLGNINFNAPVTLNVARNLFVNGAVTSTSNLSLFADSDNNGVGGLEVTGTGSLNIAGNLTLSGSDLTTESGTSIDIQSGASISVGGSLSILGNQGNSNIVLNGAVASTGANPINITPAGSGVIQLGNNVSSVGGAINFNQAVNITTGAVTVNAGNGAINFAQAINGAGSTLTLQNNPATNGTVTFANNVTLAGLTVNSNTILNGSSVTTSGAQTYNGAVTLGSNIALTSSNSNISFNNTLDGGVNLTFNVPNGNITFANAVGSHARLGTVQINQAQNVTEQGKFKVANFIQLAGNLTDFGAVADIDATGTVNVIANIIQGLIVANNANLFGTQGINVAVNIAGALTVGGNNGGTLTGLLGGHSTPMLGFAWTTLDQAFLSNTSGIFTLNNLPIISSTMQDGFGTVVYTNPSVTDQILSPTDYQTGEIPAAVSSRTIIDIDNSSIDVLAAQNVCR